MAYDLQRNSKRINVNMPFKFHVLEGEEDYSFPKSGAVDEIFLSLGKIENEISKIKTLLKSVDISKLISGQIVDLSGTGLRFFSAKLFKAGEKMKLNLTLPFKEKVSVDLVGEIVWADDKKTDLGYESALKFVDIREKEESLIVKYTFKREREERKKSIDGKSS